MRGEIYWPQVVGGSTENKQTIKWSVLRRKSKTGTWGARSCAGNSGLRANMAPSPTYFYGTDLARRGHHFALLFHFRSLPELDWTTALCSSLLVFFVSRGFASLWFFLCINISGFRLSLPFSFAWSNMYNFLLCELSSSGFELINFIMLQSWCIHFVLPVVSICFWMLFFIWTFHMRAALFLFTLICAC